MHILEHEFGHKFIRQLSITSNFINIHEFKHKMGGKTTDIVSMEEGKSYVISIYDFLLKDSLVKLDTTRIVMHEQ